MIEGMRVDDEHWSIGGTEKKSFLAWFSRKSTVTAVMATAKTEITRAIFDLD